MRAFVIAVVLLTIGASSSLRAQTIQGDSLIIHLKSGERVAIALSTIQKITFDSTSSDAVQTTAPSVTGLQLSPSFPNPSHSGTNIEFSIPTAGSVSISIYDSKGYFVQELEVPNAPAGQNQIRWDGLDDRGAPVMSGAYFYEVRFGGDVQTKQMVVIK